MESGEVGTIRAGTIRHDGETVHREVNLIAWKRETGSDPPRLKNIFPTVRAHLQQHCNCLCLVYIVAALRCTARC